MIDINEFDAIRIGLASQQADSRLVVRRGDQARDHQLPHAQARARRPLLRAHLRSDQGLGVLLRQVQARPLQGHHLRALRRRGDPPEGAPRAHGPHRPGRARLAHLVLQGRPEPHRLPARHRAARAREGPLLRRLDRHLGGHRGAPEGPERPRGQGQGRVRADLRRPRREPRRARGPPQAAPRVLHQGQGAQLRRGRRLLGAAASRTGPRSRACRRSRRCASSSGRCSSRSPTQITTEDSKKIRELVRNSAIRDDRRLSPKELETVANVAIQIREALAPLYKELAKATGSKKGAITKHINRVLDGLLDKKASVHEEDVEPRRQRRPEAAREGARPRQGPPARGARAGRAGREPRRAARADERPLPAHRREDLQGGPRRDRPVGDQGARDVPGHRVAQGRREGGRRRLGAPPRGDLAAVPRARAEADRQRRADLPRAQGPLRLPVRLRRLLPGRHGRGVDPRAAQGPRPRRRRPSRCARRSRPRRARSSSARSSG